MMTPTQTVAVYVNRNRALRDMILPSPHVLKDIRLARTEHLDGVLVENVLLNPVRQDTALPLPHVLKDILSAQTVCPETALAGNVLPNPVRQDTALPLLHVRVDKNWKQTVCPETALAENVSKITSVFQIPIVQMTKNVPLISAKRFNASVTIRIISIALFLTTLIPANVKALFAIMTLIVGRKGKLAFIAERLEQELPLMECALILETAPISLR